MGKDIGNNIATLRSVMIIVLPITLFVSVCAILLYQKEVDHTVDLIRKEQQAVVEESRQIIKARFNGPQRDVHYLSNHYAIQRFLTSGTDYNPSDLNKSFSHFMNSRLGLYSQLRYINEDGKEIIRIENDKETRVIAPDLLQHKGDRYYVKEALMLNAGEVYTSPLDLNVEHGKVEQPYKPMLRFASRVYDENLAPKGFIILNYLGKPLLDRLRGLLLSDSPIELWLLNAEGYWISHPSKNMEWGFMFPGYFDIRLSTLQPKLWELLTTDFGHEKQWIEYDAGFYTALNLTGEMVFHDAENATIGHTASFEHTHLDWYVVAGISKEKLGLYTRPILYRYSVAYGVIISLICLIGFFWGRSNRRRYMAEKAVQDAHYRTSIATKAAGVGIWEYNLIDNSLSWDDRMYALYGVDPGAFSGAVDAWENGVHPDDIEESNHRLSEAINGAGDFDIQFRIVTPAGDIRWIQANAKVVRDASGTAVNMIGTNYDITEQEKYAREIEEARERAEQMAVAKSEFLANMSHEIRTPMNGVIGIAELLTRTELSDKQRDYLEMINSSAKTLLALLNDILDLSKIESGKMTLEMHTVNLDEHIGDIVKGMSLTAHSKDLDLHYYISPSVPQWVDVDSVRLGQIIFNLVGNAIKFTAKGEVNVTINMVECDTTVGDTLTLEIVVKDTGIGIAPELQKIIMEPFQQADGSVTRKFGGTGLGLSIVTNLVDLMQGSLVLESESGKGTRIAILLPVTKSENQEVYPETIESLRQHLQNCLVLDDNPINLRWLEDMITSWGGKAQTCSSVADALRVLKASQENGTPIDIMLIDKNLPDESGFDLVTQIRSLSLTMPSAITMLSSSQADSDIAQAKSLGIDHYLMKPVKQSEVYNGLLRVFSGNQLSSVSNLMLEKTDSPLKVLIVEDNFVNQRLAEDTLRDRGHHTELAEHGGIAVEKIKTTIYDVILMDVQMPILDGYAATHLIRQLEKSSALSAISPVKIIGLTANALEGDREKCIAAGMDGYLAKPIMPELLIETVENSVPRKEARQDAEQGSIEDSIEDSVHSSSPQKQFSTKKIYFDLHKATQITGGKASLLMEMVQMISINGPELTKEISEMLVSSQVADAANGVHKLKGMISILCTNQLSGVLKDYEIYLLDASLEPSEEPGEGLSNWDNIREQLVLFFEEISAYATGEKL